MRLIDGDALMRKFKTASPMAVDGRARQMVEDMPTIEERKTGKWIHDGCNFKGGIDWMHCSECGHQDLWDATTRTPFCGWCGARMQEGEKE